MNTQKQLTNTRMTDLADELAMYSTQLRESLSGEGDPPHPWNLEPWLNEYARAFKQWKTYNVQSNRPARLYAQGPVHCRVGQWVTRCQ